MVTRRHRFSATIAEMVAIGDGCGLCLIEDEIDHILADQPTPRDVCFLSCNDVSTYELHVYVLLVDECRMIIIANDEAREWLGNVALEGKYLCDVLSSPLREIITENLARVARTHQPYLCHGLDHGHPYDTTYIPTASYQHKELYLIVRREAMPMPSPSRHFLDVCEPQVELMRVVE